MTTPSRLVVLALLLICCGKFTAAQRVGSCTANTTDVRFGAYTGSMIRVTATLRLSCGGSPTFAIGLNSGTAPGATVTNRSMSGFGSTQLNYGLFSDPGYTQNWGNTPGTGWVIGTSNGTIRLFTIYAQLPANQLVPANLYNDTITVLILPLSGTTFAPVVARFAVSATVSASCTLSATDLAFGGYSGSLIDAVSKLSVNCTTGTPYNVGLSAGNALFATVTNRRMQGPGTTRLNYNLLRDPARTMNWGTTIEIDTVAGRGTGTTQSLTVYGRLPGNQTALRPGNYSDMITATVYF